MKNIIQLVQEVLAYTKDYSSLSKLNYEDMKQKSFVFSYEDQESRIESVLDKADKMTVVFEFECFLDIANSDEDDTESEIEQLLDYCNLNNMDMSDTDEILELLYDCFINGRFLINKKYKETRQASKHHSLSEWINDNFNSVDEIVDTCELKLKTEYKWIEHDISFAERTAVEEYMTNYSGSNQNKLKSLVELIKTTFNTIKVEVVSGKKIKKESDTWYIEEDGSLKTDINSNGYLPVEIVTSHLPAKDCIKCFNNFYTVMDDHYDVRTNTSTGFHMNITLANPIDFIKLIVMTRDNVSLERFKRLDTKASMWCISQYNLLKNNVINMLSLDYKQSDIIYFYDLDATEQNMEEFFPKEYNKKLYENIIKYINSVYTLRTNISQIQDISLVCQNMRQIVIIIINSNRLYEANLNQDYLWMDDVDPNNFSNHYAIITKDKVNSSKTFNDRVKSNNYSSEIIENEILPLMRTQFENKSNMFMHKYRSINFLKYKTGNMVEFRIMGDDYLGNKYDEVKKTIKWFIFMIAISSDTELYKEDYYQLIREMIHQ